MWREDGLYDLVVVVGYNDDPPEGEWGSAIFLHVARDDLSPTRGCVAFSRDDLLELMTLIGRDTRINVLSLSAQESKPSSPDEDDDMKQFEDFDERDW
jgi:L,D-peptidoglycan transpeptidase YkuD (ErfK/YbiS/YcfS/YnhG family)